MKLNHIYHGDSLSMLKVFPDESINCCITSPPYWGLRDYGHKDQLGLEKTPEEYVDKMVDIFSQVKRVLKKDGTLWVNLGDSYSGNCSRTSKGRQGFGEKREGVYKKSGSGLKSKDLVGIPWMVAFALRADGWYLRQDIIWNKPNPMPESVNDRCTKSHEYIFLLSKSNKYYFNSEAIQEKATGYDGRKDTINKGSIKYSNPSGWDTGEGSHNKKIGNYQMSNAQSLSKGGRERWKKRKNEGTGYGGDGSGLHNHSGYNSLDNPYIRNKRSVWTLPTKPFSGAHFATFPEELILPCVLSGCPEGGIVLDPFMGSGTTALVAKKNGCNYVGCELNQEYIDISNKRLSQEYLFK